MKYSGVFGTLFTMVKTEGPRSLYSGLVAGLQRQMSFASIRIGLYDTMKQLYSSGSDSMCQSVSADSWALQGLKPLIYSSSRTVHILAFFPTADIVQVIEHFKLFFKNITIIIFNY